MNPQHPGTTPSSESTMVETSAGICFGYPPDGSDPAPADEAMAARDEDAACAATA